MNKEAVVFVTNAFRFILDEIIVYAQKISLLLEKLETEKNSLGLQAKDDFKTIQESLEALVYQTEDLYELPTERAETAEEWKKNRHDLRALVGGMKGYAELILEDIGEVPSTASFHEVVSLAEAILPLVEKLRIEEPKEILLEEPAKESYTVVKPGRILIIDDSVSKRGLIARRLLPVGHEVLHAEDGFQGLEKARLESVDLILLDILMPGISGYEVLRHLKKDARTRNVPVLVISSVSELDSVVECITYGADDYLPTPVNPVLLHARINACLERKRLQDREKKAQEELASAWKRLDAAIESIDEGFAIFDEKERLTLCNRPFREIFTFKENILKEGISYEAFLRQGLREGLYQEERRNGRQNLLGNEDAWIQEHLQSFREGDSTLLQRFSSGQWFEVIENKMPDGGTVIIFKDVTIRIEQQKYMHYLAHHDPLTGLANRSLFEKELKEKLEEGDFFGLVFLDLDGFKDINDTYGHAYGDYLLQEVGRRLTAKLRDTDLIARLGGDEFVVILSEIGSYKELRAISQRIFEAVGSTVSYEGMTADFGVSMGCALFPLDADNRKELLKCADRAMYEAKKGGKKRFVLAREFPQE